MKPLHIWLSAAALALCMSVVWGDDDASQATADDSADALQAAQLEAHAVQVQARGPR